MKTTPKIVTSTEQQPPPAVACSDLLEATAYREWIAHEIYKASCGWGGAIPWKWCDISEESKEEWRKRADEAVKRMASNVKVSE